MEIKMPPATPPTASPTVPAPHLYLVTNGCLEKEDMYGDDLATLRNVVAIVSLEGTRPIVHCYSWSDVRAVVEQPGTPALDRVRLWGKPAIPSNTVYRLQDMWYDPSFEPLTRYYNTFIVRDSYEARVGTSFGMSSLRDATERLRVLEPVHRRTLLEFLQGTLDEAAFRAQLPARDEPFLPELADLVGPDFQRVTLPKEGDAPALFFGRLAEGDPYGVGLLWQEGRLERTAIFNGSYDDATATASAAAAVDEESDDDEPLSPELPPPPPRFRLPPAALRHRLPPDPVALERARLTFPGVITTPLTMEQLLALDPRHNPPEAHFAALPGSSVESPGDSASPFSRFSPSRASPSTTSLSASSLFPSAGGTSTSGSSASSSSSSNPSPHRLRHYPNIRFPDLTMYEHLVPSLDETDERDEAGIARGPESPRAAQRATQRATQHPTQRPSQRAVQLPYSPVPSIPSALDAPSSSGAPASSLVAPRHRVQSPLTIEQGAPVRSRPQLTIHPGASGYARESRESRQASPFDAVAPRSSPRTAPPPRSYQSSPRTAILGAPVSPSAVRFRVRFLNTDEAVAVQFSTRLPELYRAAQPLDFLQARYTVETDEALSVVVVPPDLVEPVFYSELPQGVMTALTTLISTQRLLLQERWGARPVPHESSDEFMIGQVRAVVDQDTRHGLDVYTVYYLREGALTASPELLRLHQRILYYGVPYDVLVTHQYEARYYRDGRRVEPVAPHARALDRQRLSGYQWRPRSFTLSGADGTLLEIQSTTNNDELGEWDADEEETFDPEDCDNYEDFASHDLRTGAMRVADPTADGAMLGYQGRRYYPQPVGDIYMWVDGEGRAATAFLQCMFGNYHGYYERVRW